MAATDRFADALGTRSPVDGVVIHERQMGSAMKLGGRYDLVPLVNPWVRVAGDLGVDADRVVERARALAGAAPQAVADAAADPAIIALGSPVVRDLVERVVERSARCLGVL